jgi:endoglucanase
MNIKLSDTFKALGFITMFNYVSMASAATYITYPSAVTDFGKINVGSTKSITYTVKNSSTKGIRLDSFWFNTTDSFSKIGGTCAFNGTTTVRSGKSCTVTIQYAPKYAGLENETLTIGFYPGTSWTWMESNLALKGEGLEIVTTTPTPTPSPTPTPTTTGWLNVSGNKIVNELGQTVILKGLNIADPEQLNLKYWERPGVSARSVASVVTDNLYAEVVRIPILPGNASYPNEGFFSTTNGYDKYFNDHVLPLVNEVTSKGRYAIIDLHYVSDYSALYPKVAEFWTYMAPKFANNPKVIYEIFNEPIYPDDWTTWKNTIAQPATDLIRKYAPNNLVLVGGPYWSSHISGALTNPVVGNNVAYVAHVYSNQSATLWASRYGEMVKKYPLFVTEWGFEEGGTEGGNLTWGSQFESWLRTNGVSWTVWSYDTLWGPRMVNPDWTLKETPTGMGTFVRDLLVEEKTLNPLP